MKYFTEYEKHNPVIVGKRKRYDNTIYSFDIETTSYLILNGKIYNSSYYESFTKEQQQQCEKHSMMYIWMFGINDDVYYGRTWDELKLFLSKIEECSAERKIIWIHNLAFEFQFMKSVFNFDDVFARKSRKVIKCKMHDYNFELHCSMMLSNTSLKNLADVYSLPVQKMVGDLDYDVLRNSKTILTDKEMGYCEHDILVLYHYIKLELQKYVRIDKIPMTSTGKVRRELMELIHKDYTYKRRMRDSINYVPHIYQLLNMAYAGGYTHANRIYASDILKNIDSYDFASSYPFVLLCFKYPSSRFKKCKIKNVSEMHENFAYLLRVQFFDIECKYFNTFISYSKCIKIDGGHYDNGRIIKAKMIEIVLTDVDFRFFLKTYKCKYIIKESYYAVYNFLPKTFLDFILEKYVKKTELKGVHEKKIEYQIQKSMLNSIYGMTVTRNIVDDVKYDNINGWQEIPLTNEQIEVKLYKEFKKGFFSFATGVWCTSWARNNLLECVRQLDEYACYMDTDSMKLLQGYDKSVIDNYNQNVINRIKNVSKILNIPFNKFAPSDIKGNKHIIGLFECETEGKREFTYDRFITQGAKKYAVEIDGNVEITVAGVPKEKGALALKRLEDFQDGFVFQSSITEKQTVYYVDKQEPSLLIDYLGNKELNEDVSGCCFVPCSYELGKAEEYAELLTESSSNRSWYKEEL